MTKPFDAAQDLVDAPHTGVRQRPRDAATLIILRGDRHPEVLMGRRAPGHVFMAAKWVFPGGRIERAITPPGRTRRFDARFFLAPVEALLHPEPTAGSGELDEIAWLPLAEARALDLPAITRFVLNEIAERRDGRDRPRPFVRMVRGRHVVSHD